MPMGTALRRYGSSGWDEGGRELSLFSAYHPPHPPFSPNPRTPVLIQKNQTRSLLLPRVIERKFTPVLFSSLGLIAPLRVGAGAGAGGAV